MPEITPSDISNAVSGTDTPRAVDSGVTLHSIDTPVLDLQLQDLEVDTENFCVKETNAPCRVFMGTFFNSDSWTGALVFDKEYFDKWTKAIDTRLKLHGRALSWCYGQWETCPRTGAIHAHFCMRISGSGGVRGGWLNKLLVNQDGISTRAYFRAIYNMDGAKTYCSKESTKLAGPFEMGSENRQGKKRPLTEIVAERVEQLRSEGHSNAAIIRMLCQDDETKAFMVTNTSRVGDFIEVSNNKEPHYKLDEVVLLVGESRSGKSYDARQLSNSVYVIPKTKNGNLYWPNYNYQEVCLWEEFTGAKIQFQDWKELVDPGAKNFLGNELAWRYTCQNSNSKNNMAFGSRMFVFTSNRLPTSWWKDETVESLDTIKGRFTKIIYYGGNYEKGTNWRKVFETQEDLDDFWKFAFDYKDTTSDRVYYAAKAAWYICPACNQPAMGEGIYF